MNHLIANKTGCYIYKSAPPRIGVVRGIAGKIESGETAEECLIRELYEELGVSVLIDSALTPATHCYPDFTVTLYPFTCRLTGGTVTMYEHHALKWVEPRQMPGLDWAAADLPVIREYMNRAAENAIV